MLGTWHAICCEFLLCSHYAAFACCGRLLSTCSCVAGLITGVAESCQAQQVANIWWAFGTLRMSPSSDVQVLSDPTHEAPRLVEVECSAVRTSCLQQASYVSGEVRTRSPWCMQAALSRRMLALLQTCTPQNLCNALWAHAKVRGAVFMTNQRTFLLICKPTFSRNQHRMHSGACVLPWAITSANAALARDAVLSLSWTPCGDATASPLLAASWAHDDSSIERPLVPVEHGPDPLTSDAAPPDSMCLRSWPGRWTRRWRRRCWRR